MRTFAQKPKTSQQTASAKSMKSSRAFWGQSRDVDSILHLQRTIGNQAVLRLLQSNGQKSQDISLAGASTRFSHNFCRIPVHAGGNGHVVQPKLNVNAPGDKSEQEADRIADKVLSENNLEKGNRKIEVQTKPSPQVANDNLDIGENLESRLHRRNRSGNLLSDETRGFFEPRMQFGFGNVRVHTDNEASRMSRQLSARAFTHGTDIYFGGGQYDPASPEGKRLLAHELTHVIQQSHHDPIGSRIARDITKQTIQRTTLASIPLQQRRTLQIRTQRPMLTPQQIQRFFHRISSGAWGMTISAPGGATVQLGAGIPQTLQTPLTTVAGHLNSITVTQSGQSAPLLGTNTVVTVRMDLTSYGGAAGLYRYTFYNVPASGQGGNLLIESLSPIGSPQGGPLQVATHTPGTGGAAGTISAGGHTFHLVGSQNLWDPARIASVREALSLMPATVLARAAGLRIGVQSGGLGTGVGSRDEGGHYDPSTDTVTLYLAIWGQGRRRSSVFGAGQQMRHHNPVQVIAHEIAHAIDRRILRQAERTYEQSAGTQGDLNTLLATRSLSGGRFVVSGGSYGFSDALAGTQGIAFRQAYIQDGASISGGRIQHAVTMYGAQEWQEVYAEAFSLYITDPEALRQVRPNVYQHFATQFPRQQSNVFVRVANSSSPAQIIQANNLAQRSIDVAALRRLNPELQSNTTVAAGTVIWLRAREVPALATGFEPIAERYFGSRHQWPTVWRFNPEIRDPASIQPTTRIHLQSAADRTQFGEVSLSQ